MIGFFDEIPQEIDDAAIMDGCTRFEVLWRVMLPMVRPGLVTASLFGAIFIWNEFLVALYVIDSREFPDHRARRCHAGQRATADRLEHRRSRGRGDGRSDPDLLALRAALYRAWTDRRSRKMNSGEAPVLVASGLGWPEGPTVRADGSVVFVESYRSQLTVVDTGGETRRFAYTAGAPNACVLGGDGALYVCQNGGTVGPWRAAEMTTPSIQRVSEGGTAETLVTEIAGISLNGPNDLVFHADGRLIFTDPGTYKPGRSEPELHLRHRAGRQHQPPRRLSRTRLPQRDRRRGRRRHRVGTSPTPAMSAACGPTAPSKTSVACPVTTPSWTA